MRIALGLLATGVTFGSYTTISRADDFPWLRERKIMGANNLEPIESTGGTDAYDFERAVARVENLDGIGFCTGSRVAEDLFLTNFHCDIGCADMRFTLDYENQVEEAHRPHFKCVELIRKVENLDYSLFKVEPLEPAASEEPQPADRLTKNAVDPETFVLTLSRGTVKQGMKLLVAGHPGARLKEIDRSDECILSSTEITHTDSGRDTMKHMCDTEGGSSGSPLLDRTTGYAIGLHWGGHTGDANYAISMKMILEDMEANVPAATFSELTIAD